VPWRHRPEAEAVALDGGHRGLGQLGEDPEALVHPAQALVVVAHLLGRGAPGHPVLGHAPDHHHPDVVVEADPVGQRTELAGGLPAPGVELVREVIGQSGDAVAADVESELPLLLR
jgi:hypothetical protein